MTEDERQNTPPQAPPDQIAAMLAAAAAPIADPETPIPLDRKELEKFVRLLAGEADAEIDFATFFDRKGAGKPKEFPKRLRGSVAKTWRRLAKKNAAGLGVFVTISESNGQSFEDKDITRPRAVFIDDDGKGDTEITPESLEAAGLRPSISVNTSERGAHFYWLIDWRASDTLDSFELVQKALALKFGTDLKICNRGRVMRAPGLLHQKGEPFQTFIVDCYEDRGEPRVARTLDDIVEAFGLDLTAAKAAPTTPVASAALTALALYVPQTGGGLFAGINDACASNVPSILSVSDRVKRAAAYISRMGPAIEGKGGDLHTFKVLATVLHDFDLEIDDAYPLITEWNQACQPPWEEKDLMAKCISTRQSVSKKAPAGSKALALEKMADAVTEFHVPPLPAWTTKHPTKGPLVFFRGSKEGEHGAIAVQGEDGEMNWIRQEQPTAEQLAEQSPTIIHYLNHLVLNKQSMGNRVFAVSPENLAKPSSDDSLIAAVTRLCRAMMGGTEPIPSVVKTAADIVRARPYPDEMLAQIRWTGETKLAMHEIPTPKEGDWSAHKELVSRASCPDTLMAWVWTCFIPEELTGREALFLWGQGNDGKSEWCRALAGAFGPSGTSSEILKGENRFELANLVDKRLVYFGDFRNPRPIHSKIMREIISGANLSFEFKGKDMASAYFHPRCLLSTNVEPRILVNDSAERTRVRRVNIAPIPGNKGDRNWPIKLAKQMPAFLFECRAVWERFAVPGQDLPYTQACLDALSGGVDATEEEFDSLLERIEITSNTEDRITTRRLVEIFESIKYAGWNKENAYRYLRSRGGRDKDENGKKFQQKEKGGIVRKYWTGIKELSTGVFDNIHRARLGTS